MIASPNKNTYSDEYYTATFGTSATATWHSPEVVHYGSTWYAPSVCSYSYKTKQKPRRHYMSLNKFTNKLKDMLFFHKDWGFNKKFNGKTTLISQNANFYSELKSFYHKEKMHLSKQIPIEDKVSFFTTGEIAVLEFIGFTSLKFQAFICKYNLKLQPTQTSGKEIPDWMKPNQEFYESYFKNMI